MRALWTIARIVIAFGALATLLLAAVFVVTPSGTTIDTQGAVIDAAALVIFVVVAWSLWRDRKSLF